MPTRVRVRVDVNGRRVEREVEPRLLLADFLRHDLGLKATHLGCEHGVCGACTIRFNGETARSCLLFAVQADGATVETLEGLNAGDELTAVREAFHEQHALQCGYCTPGFLVAVHELLRERPDPSEHEVRAALSGNLCRCTGYVNIVAAVRAAARKLRDAAGVAR
jgi:carbon-monoxide dehydrogenase small subunit